MKRTSRNPVSLDHSRQQGVALAVVLILLVVMSLLALASLRGTLMEERMTSNMRDRSLSFQSAEAALRAGEAFVQGKPTLPTSGCDASGCGKPDPSATTPVWQGSTGWVSATVPSDMPAAQYLVELLADDVPPKGSCTTSGDVSETTCSGNESRYRVTARSNVAGRSEVTLQSIYSVP